MSSGVARLVPKRVRQLPEGGGIKAERCTDGGSDNKVYRQPTSENTPAGSVGLVGAHGPDPIPSSSSQSLACGVADVAG